MNKLSKKILVLEALLMTYPTLLGFLLCFGAITPYMFSGNTQFINDFALGLVVFLSLISGWRLFFWVISDGPRNGNNINIFWWVFVSIGAILAIIALISFVISKFVVSVGLPLSNSFLIYGGIFIIPLFHLLVEFKMQKKC